MNKAKRCDSSICEGTLDRLVREDLSEEITFTLGLNWWEEAIVQLPGLRTFKAGKKASTMGLEWEGTERNVSYIKDDRKKRSERLADTY